MHEEVTLSDGLPCQVRVLGLFELDTLGPDIPGPYRYQVLTYTGVIYEIEYTLPDTPPDKPGDPAPEPNSPDWHQLKDWDVYQAALAHEKNRLCIIEAWLNNCADYILLHCVVPEDRTRLVEADDYQAIYAAALVPRLKLEDIEVALRQTFRAEYGGQGILEALWKLEPGEGKLDPVALWEAQLLNELGLVTSEQEAAYAQLPVMTRARKVAAFKLADWLASLEVERVRKDTKRGA